MTAEAVCNCPRGGIKRRCKMRQRQCKLRCKGLWSWYRPTRPGAMRIENGDGHTWPADVRTHGRGHSAIPSPFCGVRGSHLVRFYLDTCGPVPRHSAHHVRTCRMLCSWARGRPTVTGGRAHNPHT